MVSVDVKHHVHLLSMHGQSPWRDQEQGDGAGLSYRMVCLTAELLIEECIKSPGEIISSHSWMVCLAAALFLSSHFSDTAFVILFRLAVQTAVSEIHN